MEGGRIEKDAQGDEVFVIPIREPVPSKFEDLRNPGPIANSRFTDAEVAQITAPSSQKELSQAVDKFAAGWTIANCGPDMDPGLRDSELGRKGVLVIHPLDKDTACVLSKNITIPAGKTTTLRLGTGHHPRGDWDLIVQVDGKPVLRKTIGKSTAVGGWLDVDVDLSSWAGKTVKLELLNQPTGWSFEAAYWSKIAIDSQPTR
jgi:hypothetical protein